jgi:hypothetical protein
MRRTYWSASNLILPNVHPYPSWMNRIAAFVEAFGGFAIYTSLLPSFETVPFGVPDQAKPLRQQEGMVSCEVDIFKLTG